MILIFYAMRAELSGLRKLLRERRPLENGLRGLRATIGGQEVALIATGVGTARARHSANRAFAILPGTGLAIATGVAGALSVELKAGDLVIADRVLTDEADDRQTARPMPLSAEVLRSTESVLRRAGLRFATGAFLTTGGVLATAEAKHAARIRTGAIAADMESAAIAIEAAAGGVPLVCLRAVLDEVEDEIPGAELANPGGKVKVLRAAAFLFKNPAALARIPGLLKKLSRATNSLAGALEAICACAEEVHGTE